MMTWDSEEGEGDDGEQSCVPPQVVAEPSHDHNHDDEEEDEDDYDEDHDYGDENEDEADEQGWVLWKGCKDVGQGLRKWEEDWRLWGKTKLGNLSMRKVDRVFADNDDNHDYNDEN